MLRKAFVIFKKKKNRKIDMEIKKILEENIKNNLEK